MNRKPEIWTIIAFETLFVLCAISVIVYRILGIAFDFGFLSYRVFNIAFSILFIFYLIYALLKSYKYTMILVLLFSLFHFVEGIFINFWFKTIIHGFILVSLGVYYYRHKTLVMRRRD